MRTRGQLHRLSRPFQGIVHDGDVGGLHRRVCTCTTKALNAEVITKIIRVTMLAPFLILLLAWLDIEEKNKRYRLKRPNRKSPGYGHKLDCSALSSDFDDRQPWMQTCSSSCQRISFGVAMTRYPDHTSIIKRCQHDADVFKQLFKPVNLPAVKARELVDNHAAVTVDAHISCAQQPGMLQCQQHGPCLCFVVATLAAGRDGKLVLRAVGRDQACTEPHGSGVRKSAAIAVNNPTITDQWQGLNVLLQRHPSRIRI